MTEHSVDNDLDRHEVLRKLPELKEINDDALKEDTIYTFVELCPDYFWEVPASSSGRYHPKGHRENRGLWLHTKRAFTLYQRFAPSMKLQDKLTPQELDYGRAAILLHDMYKYGWPKQDHTTKDHDVVCAEKLREGQYIHEDVIGCVETHNGPWYKGPSPRTDLEQAHHLSDMAASDVSNPEIAVLEPSRELNKQFPNMNERNP